MTAGKPNLRDHSITFLTFYAKERLSTHENLFKRILSTQRRYVVDSNVAWEKVSADPSHMDAAFILGTTYTNEFDRLCSLLLDDKGLPRVRSNVFLFGYKRPGLKDVLAGEKTPLLVIQLLDKFCAAVFNLKDMAYFDSLDRKVRERLTNRSRSLENQKKRVLQELDLKTVAELDAPHDWTTKATELRQKITTARPECLGRFWESNDVARHAYCLLLVAANQKIKNKTRKEFLNLKNQNVFGDWHLIQNALFFEADVLSKDKAVQFMAEACGLRWFENP